MTGGGMIGMNGRQSEKSEPVLTRESTFRFACREDLPCFTGCCRDVNIYLTPYDILRLRRSLKIGSSRFLSEYTRHFLAKGSNVPVVQLEMERESLRCKFVTDDGCRVYDDRPWACRMFPLDLASVEGEYGMIAEKERCIGLCERAGRTVAEWLESQGIEPYVEMERAFGAVVPPGSQPGASMAGGLGKLLFLAYDLDRFAELLDDSRFCAFHGVDDATLQKARENDEEMLKLAFCYIRSQISELQGMF